jgi:hypothetical protein
MQAKDDPLSNSGFDDDDAKARAASGCIALFLACCLSECSMWQLVGELEDSPSG